MAALPFTLSFYFKYKMVLIENRIWTKTHFYGVYEV